MLVEVVWVTAIVERVISLAVRTGEMKWRKVVFELGRLLLLSGVRVRTAAFSFFSPVEALTEMSRGRQS
jgi:hypothetical protein